MNPNPYSNMGQQNLHYPTLRIKGNTFWAVMPDGQIIRLNKEVRTVQHDQPTSAGEDALAQPGFTGKYPVPD